MDQDLMLNSEIYTKNNILSEMIRNQRPNLPKEVRFYLQDLKRIVKFIQSSIFSKTCSCWMGYITNLNNPKKGTYINFFFRSKKKALHRLLYINFKEDLNENEYIRFKCDNKGFCCSLNCMYKVVFNKKMDDYKIDNKTKEIVDYCDQAQLTYEINFS